MLKVRNLSKVKPIIYRVEVRAGSEYQRTFIKQYFDRFFLAASNVLPMHHKENRVKFRELKR